MTSFHLAQPGWLVLVAASWIAAGLLIGALHFLTLLCNVRLLVLGRRWLIVVGLQLARAIVLGGLLAGIAIRCGAWPLLLATGGILAARTASLRWQGRQ
ncbi:MAG TPA: ATP synthase subunit I [Xanthobacteraceae bacterium]